MQVVVYDPPVERNPERWDDVVNTPLSSCLMSGYTASSLAAAGQEVELIESEEALLEAAPSVLTFHLIYQWEETEPLLHNLRRLKKEGAIPHLFVYGLFPSIAYETLLQRYPFIDGVIVGEPEITLASLVQKIQHCLPWKGTRGVAVLNQGRPSFSPRPPVQDLNRLPFPRRNRLIQGTAYLQGSRGCYGRCRFCTVNALYEEGSGWRGRSPENIVEEMEKVVRQFGASYFYFADANFFGPGQSGKQRAAKLSKLIHQKIPGARFGLECRADNVDESVLAELQETGLEDVFLGVESFSEPVLQRFNKGVPVRQNVDAIKTLKRLGLSLSLGFIMFDRQTTLEDVRVNFETLKTLDLLIFPSNTAHLLSHRVFLLQGSPFFHEDPGTGYETEYEISESKVNALYDFILPMCKKVLQDVKGDDFERHLTANHSEINNRLIQTFEDALGSLERESKTQRKPLCSQKEFP